MSQEQSQICPVVELVNDRPATTSLKISECFGKQHKHIIRDIETLLAECPKDFHRLNFELMSRKVKIGDGAERGEPYYIVYFDGFILLVMGYTGKKALAMKLAYIGAFNAMREKLENQKARKAIASKQASLPAKDKYEAYLEKVESLRSRTWADIDVLLHEGLKLVAVEKLGPGATIGFVPIFIDWLQQVVAQHAPILNPNEPLDRAIDYSPLCLIRYIEKYLPAPTKYGFPQANNFEPPSGGFFVAQTKLTQ